MDIKIVFWDNESNIDLKNKNQKSPEKATHVSPDMQSNNKAKLYRYECGERK